MIFTIPGKNHWVMKYRSRSTRSSGGYPIHQCINNVKRSILKKDISNSLPNDKIFVLSKSKAFADDKISHRKFEICFVTC